MSRADVMSGEPMKVLLPARHGLGDVLACYFISDRGRAILARVRAGLAGGRISSAIIAYEHAYNPSTGDLFSALPFNLTVKKTSELPGVAEWDHDNRMPDVVQGHQNIYTNPPDGFNELDCSQWVACPTRQPHLDLPKEFVLFSDGARAPDRLLADAEICDFLKQVTGLPIVKVGHGYDVVPADVNLCNRLHIIETFYLAQHARIVVSALTMFRTAAALFGTPVVELAEHASAQTLRRTEWEYAGGQYGMTPDLNRWFTWPADREHAGQTIRSMMMRTARRQTVPGAAPASTPS